MNRTKKMMIPLGIILLSAFVVSIGAYATSGTYYLPTTWIDENQVHNWGLGSTPGYAQKPGWTFYMEEGEKVRLYFDWIPGDEVCFKVGLTKGNSRYDMQYPIKAGYTWLTAPSDGYYYVRIDNTYGGSSTTYDGNFRYGYPAD